MAVPKRKTSKARKRKRRSHLKLASPGMARCSQCHSWKRPHTLCSNCGHYAGREVFRIEEEL